jgi:outer membrane receptor protein involved in Fe transport
MLAECTKRGPYVSRSLRWGRTLVAAALSLAVGVPVLAGSTGRLIGRVVDEKKQPLPGVSIRIEGQRLGAITDDRGTYFIIGIPGGHCTVRMSLIGYAAFAAANVEITPDFSTTLDATLETEAAQTNEVVNAERPLLQKDATGTVRFLSGNEIQRLPTRGYREALAQEPGVVNIVRQIDLEGTNSNTLVLRGGLPDETAYYVDGFSRRDPLTGNSSNAINNSAIEEVVLLNGGFNAEYGRIMSGVVNVVTKEGGQKYSGSFEALTDNLTGTGDPVFDSGISDYNVYDGAFGGPLIKGHALGSFYVSGQRRLQYDRAPRSNYTEPLPSNSLGGWTGQGRLRLTFGPNAGLKLGVLNTRDDWTEYRNSYRFDLAHMPRHEDRNQSYTGEFHHRLNARFFYTIGTSFLRTARKRGDGLFFDDLAAYSATANPQLNVDIPWFFPGLSGTPGDPLSDTLAARVLTIPGSTGALWDDYLRHESQGNSIRADFTSQINASHQVKAGVQGDKYEVRFYQNYFPSNFTPGQFDINAYGFDENANEGELSPLDGARRPITASAYIQDGYERGGVHADVGLRYDYLNVNEKALVNPDQPLGPDFILTDADLTDARTYGRISPRVGVGFPVSRRSMLHLNWGQFYQQPDFRELFVSYRFLDYKIRKGGYPVPFGNPNLKPEMTVAYEAGIAHQLNDFATFDVSAYYKDVKDHVQVALVPSAPYSFAAFRNVGGARLMGVDLGFTLRRVHHIDASLGYSLSSARGTGAGSNSRNIAWTASSLPKPPEQPLEFDQRHKLSVNLGLSFLKNEGPKWGSHTPLADVDVNVLYNLASAMPYSSTLVLDEVTQLNVAGQPTGVPNVRTGPFTQALDFKITKGIQLRGPKLDAYVWVLNAFNTANALLDYQGTGSPYTTGFLDTQAGRAVAAQLRQEGIDPDHAYALATHRSDMFTSPRSVQFGLRMDF